MKAALFLLMLVLVMPITLSQIQSVTVFGEDEVDGFRKTDDRTIVEARFIGNQKLEANSNGVVRELTDCKEDGDSKICRYTSPKITTRNSEYYIFVVQKNEQGYIIDRTSKTVKVDSNVPTINALTIH